MQSLMNSDRGKRVADATRLISRWFGAAAGIAITLSGLAYVVGTHYFQGYFLPFGTNWASTLMDPLLIADRAFQFLLAMAIWTAFLLFAHVNQVKGFSFQGLSRLLILVVLISISFHLIVKHYGYYSYWWIVSTNGFICLLGALLAEHIVKLDEPATLVSKLRFALFALGLLLVPFLVGVVQGGSKVDEGSSTTFVELEDARCGWALIAPLSKDRLLVGRLDMKPIPTRVIDVTSVQAFHFSRPYFCRSRPSAGE